MSLTVDVHHRQGDFVLDAKIDAGPGVLAVFGASGSGKTTLIDIIAGLRRPLRGRVALAGEVFSDTDAHIWLPPHQRQIGYVFQDSRLFPHLTVRQNLNYGTWFAHRREKPGMAAASFEQVVALLGLEQMLARMPGQLSGGESQRIAIGRALLSRPQLLILDEPLASLDDPRKAELLPFLERMRDEVRVPIVYVSHSIPEVVRLATSVAVLDRGRLTATGAVSDVLARADILPLPDRNEAGSVIEAVVENAAASAAWGGAPAGQLTQLRSAGNSWVLPHLGLSIGATVRLHVRARDVLVATTRPEGLSALNVLPGRIVALRTEGTTSVDVVLDCGGDKIIARLTSTSSERLRLAVGQPVFAIVKAVAFDRF